MQYLITLPDTPQAYALLDYLKASGIASNVKAVKNNLKGADAQEESTVFDIPAKTDKELREMMFANRRPVSEKEVNPNVKMF